MRLDEKFERYLTVCIRACLIIFLFFSKTASAQSFQTYKHFGEGGNDKITKLKSYALGGFVAAGTFTDYIILGGIEYESYGEEDIWLARFDENLEVVWAMTGGSSRKDEVEDLQIASSGAVFLTGTFWKQFFWDDLTLIPFFSNKSIFILKISPEGIVENTTSFSGNGSKRIGALAIDEQENIFMTGNFSDTLFHANTFFVSDFEDKLFASKMSDEFEVEWLSQLQGDGISRGNGVVLLPDGEVVAAGDFTGKMYLEKDSIRTGTPDEDICFAKFSNTGESVFLKKAGGVYPSFCKNIVADTDGNFYLTGDHRGVIKAGDNLQITTEGLDDNFYIIAYQADGTAKWGRSLGSKGNDAANDLQILDDRLFLTGFYEEDMVIDSKELFAGEGFFNAFFVSFSKLTGDLVWAEQAPGNEFQSGKCISGFSEKGAFAGFDFSKEVEIGNEMISTNGFFDFLTVKIVPTDIVASEQLSEPEFKIFPNPVSDFLFLEFASESLRVEIFSSQGKLVKRVSGAKKIDVSNLPKGIYVLKIIVDEEHFFTEMFAKK